MCKKLKLIVDFTTVSPSYNARCKICEKKIEVVVSFTWCPRLYFFFVRFVIELLRDFLSELLLTRCLINTFFQTLPLLPHNMHCKFCAPYSRSNRTSSSDRKTSESAPRQYNTAGEKIKGIESLAANYPLCCYSTILAVVPGA